MATKRDVLAGGEQHGVELLHEDEHGTETLAGGEEQGEDLLRGGEEQGEDTLAGGVDRRRKGVLVP